MKYPAIQNYINGKFVPSSTTKTMNVVSPLDGNLLSTVPMSSNQDLDNAVKAAQAAFPAWSKTPIKERVQVFFRYKTLLEKHLKYLLLFLIVLFASTLLLGHLWTLYNGNPDKYLVPIEFVTMSTFAGQSLLFLAGIFLAYYPKFWNQISFSKYATAIGGLGFVLTLYVIGWFQESRVDHGTNHWQGKVLFFIVLPLFIVLLFQGLMSQRTYLQQFLSSKVMVLLGNASFAFYLVHISYVNLKLKSWVFFPDRNFILLWLVSIALYYGFEKPIYDWYRKTFK
jgi:peptidoglycan/LPS O-acetylase OafA/YrhL